MRSALIAAALAALAVVDPDDAHARKFRMSGTWAMRRGAIFLPLQFVSGLASPQTSPPPHTSQGNLSMAGFPNGPVSGAGVVSATGSAPATLRLPQHRFVGTFATQIPIPGPTVVQITSMFGADGPASPATLAAGVGPGSFTWCPGDPACVAGGGMLSTDPPQGGGANGRIIYRAGASRFGGLMRMLLAGSTMGTFRYQASPFQAGHAPGSAGGGLQATGAPYAFMATGPVRPIVVTQPLVPPTSSGLITAPGPVVGTIPCNAGTGGPIDPCTLIQTGFPFTTGSVFAQQTTGTGGADFFSLMGSDQRTALGAGNLSLVAGGLTRRENPFGSVGENWASFGRVQMTLAPPTPGLSPAGLAAAALLLLLAAGYANRRR